MKGGGGHPTWEAPKDLVLVTVLKAIIKFGVHLIT